MEGEFHYRGQVVTAAEVEFIRQLMAQHPGSSRRKRHSLPAARHEGEGEKAGRETRVS